MKAQLKISTREAVADASDRALYLQDTFQNSFSTPRPPLNPKPYSIFASSTVPQETSELQGQMAEVTGLGEGGGGSGLHQTCRRSAGCACLCACVCVCAHAAVRVCVACMFSLPSARKLREYAFDTVLLRMNYLSKDAHHWLAEQLAISLVPVNNMNA